MSEGKTVENSKAKRKLSDVGSSAIKKPRKSIDKDQKSNKNMKKSKSLSPSIKNSLIKSLPKTPTKKTVSKSPKKTPTKQNQEIVLSSDSDDEITLADISKGKFKKTPCSPESDDSDIALAELKSTPSKKKKDSKKDTGEKEKKKRGRPKKADSEKSTPKKSPKKVLVCKMLLDRSM